ncbi:Transketolase [Mycoplasmopsis californica]|uniref:Transketolase n=1 Tax=Mycoplasmopsis equigenitalium TaxID=114883 RepID=A0ABY5J136_9BACT|nr:transketolase [Mycoplasmopsis equigenitalium]UUD36934.1 transketolase [Mycoplasmopsis equigenitalium]VEU69771.1 Transketolase [Mycoplasmopsis californica]
MNLDKKVIASMQGIALDAINKAGQGHIGMAIGAAPITYTLFSKLLHINKNDPKWINRDRFVLSAGHGSMSMYSIMHFLGLLSVEDIKNHKKLYSKTPSHPEIDSQDFVDASTGPLGQGIAMGVGMALSQKYLQNRVNKPGLNVIDHNIYVLHGDGCVQEGVALEAIQLAGTLNLDKLILIHDFNDVQIDSRANEVNNIDLVSYFQAQNFATFVVTEPTPENIEAALEKAKNANKPSYVQIHTVIAANTPVENTSAGHNGILDPEKTLAFKAKLGLDNKEPFEYDEDVYVHAQKHWEEKEKTYSEWQKTFEEFKKSHPEDFEFLNTLKEKTYKFDFSKVTFSETNVATRNYFSPIMKELENNPYIIGGSADLAAATKIKFAKTISEGGKYIKYGIREHAMTAINNGIFLHSNLKTIDSTFLAFADYAKGALRLGALMEIPSVHVYTHDSYQVGGDGPTHQPFDQIPMLRAMANVKVIRPCDETEMKFGFDKALNQNKEKYAIIACRQGIKSFNLLKEFKSAYVVKSTPKFDISLLASGSEVGLATEVADALAKENIKAQVVSVPLLQELVDNDKLAKELKLDKKPMFAIEATNDSMWFRLSKYNKIDAHLASTYGYSEDGGKVYALKGFSVENLVKKVKSFLIKKLLKK